VKGGYTKSLRGGSGWVGYGLVFGQSNRKTSDRIFLEAMEVLGIPKWKRYLFYYTVRLFGWWYWYRRESLWFGKLG